jgi:peptidoglycan/LPS O-acetylase OafA/YrhL
MQSNLDLLRAYAVTLVVVSHLTIFYGLSSFAMLGSVGVALFFVHTCLVLMQSLERQPHSGSLFVPFMIRRLFRIYPLSIGLLLVVVLFNIPQHEAVRHFYPVSYTLRDFVSNVLLTQHLFGTGVSIVNPMWSLSYEVQMYMLLPAIYLLVRRTTLRETFGIWVVSVLLSAAVGKAVEHATLFTYTPCFMSGVVAYKMQQKKVGNRLSSWLWVVFLVALIPAFVALGQVSVALWWIASASIGFTVPFFKQCQWKPILEVAKRIATYSYGIYITHFFCMWVALEKLRGPAFFRLIVFFVMLAGVSAAVYHLIESPFIEIGKRLSNCKFGDRFASLPAHPGHC